MQLHVKGKNLEVSDSMRSYVERKLQKLDRRVHELTEVEIELAVERNPSIADSQVAEATVHLKGRTLRARETARDMKAAVDQLADKLTRQVRDLHDKRVGGRRHVEEPASREPGRDGDHRELVGLFRRKQETLNEQLLREAGLDPAQTLGDPAPAPERQPEPSQPPPLDRVFGSDGLPHRLALGPKEWDATAAVQAPALTGDRIEFTTIPNGDVIVSQESGDADLSPLADAVEQHVSPPYRRDRRAPGGNSLGRGGEADSGRRDPVPTGRAAPVLPERRRPRVPRRQRAEPRALSRPSSSASARPSATASTSRPSESTGTSGRSRSRRSRPLPLTRGDRQPRKGPPRRRGPPPQAAPGAGRVHHLARARVREAVRRRPPGEDGGVPAAARERREPRRPHLRGVRSRPRGPQARLGPAHVRRAAHGRDRPPRGRHRGDEDRRGQDVRREPRALPQRPRRPRRAPHHHQRLPRPARRRVEPARLRVARHDRRLHRDDDAVRPAQGRPTTPTSRTGRTPSSASTTCATTWP